MTYHAIGQLNLSRGPTLPASTSLRRSVTFAFTPPKAQAMTQVNTDSHAPSSPPPPPPSTTPVKEPLAPEVTETPHDSQTPVEQPTDDYYVDPYSSTPAYSSSEPSSNETLLPPSQAEADEVASLRKKKWKWIGIGIAVLAGGAFLLTRD